MASPEDHAGKPTDRARAAAILATAGILVLLGLAVFIGTVAVPMWQTHAAVRESAQSSREADKAVERLGGPGHAARRLAAYLRLPKWLKPDRYHATHLLGCCGPAAREAVPALVETLGDEDPVLREAAALVLGRIGPEAKEAVPALVKARSDQWVDVAKAATWALWQVQAEPPRPDTRAPED